MSGLPDYATQFSDRHGKSRVRFRRTGWVTQYAQADAGTQAFRRQYNDWLAGGRVEVGGTGLTPGSFDDLIARFYKSPRFKKLGPSTQNTYRGEIERFRAKYGPRPVAEMKAQHVNTLMEQMQDTPTAANNLKKRLSQLFDYAILLDWRTDNPTKAVKALAVEGGGFKTWQEDQIAVFEAHYPLGTRERLAFDLALYTAQRRSDVRLMGPQHIEAGKIRVKQLKTGKKLKIPVHPMLAESIAATPIGHLAFITSQRGAPYTKESFGNWFGKAVRETGLVGFSLHGLRKAASRRMAEMGLSNQLIKSITGHSSDSEVARYTKDAEQERMAEIAMERLATRLANHQKSGGNAG